MSGFFGFMYSSLSIWSISSKWRNISIRLIFISCPAKDDHKHCPVALRFSKPDESGADNNDEDGDEFECNLYNNDNNSHSDESKDNNDDDASDETQWHTESNANKVALESSNNTKDDVARLIHLYKYLEAQMHWTNYCGVLSRVQLDARKITGTQAEAANALACLAALYNDYEGFTPQNAMVVYAHDSIMQKAVKKNPYEPSEDEWADLTTHTHGIETTNLS